MVGEPTEFAERVLDVVERIPPGRVMAYGDIAEYLGEGGPRQVGRVMALWGGGVPWWRGGSAVGGGDPLRRLPADEPRRRRPAPLRGRGHPAARRARRHAPGPL